MKTVVENNEGVTRPYRKKRIWNTMQAGNPDEEKAVFMTLRQKVLQNLQIL